MGKLIVNVTDSSPLSPMHGAVGLRVKEPLKNLQSSLAYWGMQALLDPSAEAVQRNSKSRDTYL